MSDSDRALEQIRGRGVVDPVDVALMAGIELGLLAESVEHPISLSFSDLAGFPMVETTGQQGRLVVGTWEGTRIALVQGSPPFCDTGKASAMASGLETLCRMGVRTLVILGTAGALHPDWYPGSIAMVSDHINFAGVQPLIGFGGDDRFVPLADAYDRTLRTRMRRAAAAANIVALREGTYIWFSGPSFETAAEIKAAKLLGADLVGLSVVPEVILARRLGIKVAALVVVTHFATGISGSNPTYAQTRSVALSGSIALKRLLRAYVRSRDDL